MHRFQQKHDVIIGKLDLFCCFQNGSLPHVHTHFSKLAAIFKFKFILQGPRASAPTVFESVGASTHGFQQLFSHFISFDKNDTKNVKENVMNSVMSWQKTPIV